MWHDVGMAMIRMVVQVPEELVAQVDQQRGDVPRAAWVRRVLEQRLAGPSTSTSTVGQNVTAATLKADVQRAQPLTRTEVEPQFKTKGKK